MTDADRARRYRDKRRGGPPRQVKACGAPGDAGARRHRRHLEPVCDLCLTAERAYRKNLAD